MGYFLKMKYATIAMVISTTVPNAITRGIIDLDDCCPGDAAAGPAFGVGG